jgi:hypothetical protein
MEKIAAHSELSQALSAWRKSRNLSGGDMYTIIDPDEVAVPDYVMDPRVTVEDQVRWADKIYDRVDASFFTCNIEQADLFKALNTQVGRAGFYSLDMKQTFDKFVSKHSSQCVLTVS